MYSFMSPDLSGTVFEFEIYDTLNVFRVVFSKNITTNVMSIELSNTIGTHFVKPPISPILGNPEYSQAVELHFAISSNGWDFYINGQHFLLFTEVVANNYQATISALRWNAVDYGGQVTNVEVVGGGTLALNRLVRVASMHPSQQLF